MTHDQEHNMVTGGDFRSLGFKNHQTRIPLTRRIWNVSHLNGWLWLDWKQRSGEFKSPENCLLWKCMQWKNEPSLSSFSTRVDPWLRNDPSSGLEVTLHNGCIMTIKSFFSSSFLSFFLSHSDALLVPSYFFDHLYSSPNPALLFPHVLKLLKSEKMWAVLLEIYRLFPFDRPYSSFNWCSKDSKQQKRPKGLGEPPPNEPQQASNLHLTYQSTYRRNLKPA